MPSNYEKVQMFHTFFAVPVSAKPELPAPDVFEYRVKFMQEELDEFAASYQEGDLVGCFDALIDLLYVVYGTADMMGLPIDEGFRIVHRANMTKVRAPSADASKRGHALDVIKPQGWEPPEQRLLALLVASGMPYKQPPDVDDRQLNLFAEGESA